MHRYLDTLDRRLRPASLALLVLAALLAHVAASMWLTASYEASGFPVPYHVAQLSFDADRLKGWYATLVAAGTLDRYVLTQLIDFAFIASVALLHPAVLLAVGRAFTPGSRLRRAMIGAATLSLIAPAADAMENLVSFAMLADPAGFPSILALVYSSLAAIKFAAFTFAYVAAAVGLAAAVMQVVRRLAARSVA